MAQTWLTTELLEAIREDGRIPDDTPDATDAKLLRVADRALVDRFAPLIRKVRAEYYVYTREIAMTADRGAYDVPSRASTISVRAVFLQDSSGGVLELTPASVSDRLAYTRSGTPCRYVIEDDQLVLLPPPSSAVVSRYTNVYVKCEGRPSTLISTGYGNLANMTRVSATSLTFLGVGVGTFASLVGNGSIVDVVKSVPPFSLLFRDRVVSSWDIGPPFSGTLTVNAIAENTYRATGGDAFLCFPGETPLPQLPAELHPALAYAVIAAWYEAIDPNTAARFETKVQIALAEYEKLLAPRNQGRQQKWRGSSLMRRGAAGGGRGGTFDDWE